MSGKDTGGPAFPVLPPLSGDVSASGYPYPAEGMTLRDYFAAKAMAAMCTGGMWPEVAHYKEIVMRSWELADAMLKERSK